MSAMDKMWVSFAGMAFLIIAMGLILWSRHKLKGILSFIIAAAAYILFITGALIIFFIVFSGPTM
ncbi:DUF2768 domain-containing protein [Virgibacillus xinjiangensis]|uniref:DUF2768 domain-containing protein n=1 Tax=Virgibacillus xinjiangensis TaxID=393090 RepID=A0ABV7CRT7_9BACI